MPGIGVGGNIGSRGASTRIGLDRLRVTGTGNDHFFREGRSSPSPLLVRDAPHPALAAGSEILTEAGNRWVKRPGWNRRGSACRGEASVG
jgi:hypothetical protein